MCLVVITVHHYAGSWNESRVSLQSWLKSVSFSVNNKSAVRPNPLDFCL